jgi:hypothetical protein
MKVLDLCKSLAASILLAMVFTFISCSNNEEEGGGGGSCGKLMSTNLNVDVAGSVCYDNDPANCTKYGRLYDWATAMNLPAKCNSTSTKNDPDCALQSKHRGICPSGQHIPSKEELDEYGSYECLKNQPGGSGHPGGNFSTVGIYGYWWSSPEYDSNYAYFRFINCSYEGMGSGHYDKSFLFSVRCVQD